MTITALDPAYHALILSDRVSARTRAALLERAAPDDPAYQPSALTLAELAILCAAVDRVLPQTTMDLGARIDQALAAGASDGWRFAILPPDVDAYHAALAGLDAVAHTAHGCGFASLTAAAQDALLTRAGAGELAAASLDAEQMRRWFEDLRGDAVKIYVAHPATLAGMGYSGIGYGGDDARKPGFHALEPGDVEPWEPVAIRP